MPVLRDAAVAVKAAEKRAAPAAGNADAERMEYRPQVMPTLRG